MILETKICQEIISLNYNNSHTTQLLALKNKKPFWYPSAGTNGGAGLLDASGGWGVVLPPTGQKLNDWIICNPAS